MLLFRADSGWLAQRDVCGGLIGEYEDDEEMEETVVARLEQTGLVVVVAVERLVLQLAAACNAEAKLLIKEDVLAAAVPLCNFAELLVERAARTVDRLLCKEVETWLVDKVDPLELFPPIVNPVVLLVV